MRLRPTNWHPTVLAAALGYLGVGLAACAAYGSWAYEALLEQYPALENPFAAAGIPDLGLVVRVAFGAAAVLALLAGGLGLRRRPWALRLARKACAAGYAALAFYAYAAHQGLAVIAEREVELGGQAPGLPQLFAWYWQLVWPAGVAALAFLALHGHALRARTIAAYGGSVPEGGAPGDRAFERLRRHGLWIALLVGAVCGVVAGVIRGVDAGLILGMERGLLAGLGAFLAVAVGLTAGFVLGSIVAFALAALVAGRDERYSRSLFASVWGHLLVIVVIPWILTFLGCIDPYRVPEGSGNPVQNLVKVVQPKKKKKKKLIVNPQSAIVYKQPEMFHEVLKEVRESTQRQYKANPNRVKGKLGKGGGKKGGWPDGMGEEPVRFVRLKYGAPGWDAQMADAAGQRAELNFLQYFKKKTGFPVAKHPEHYTIYELRRFPEGQEPPFVYMTGNGPFRIGAEQAQILREYLLGGGMLFADAGSRSWHRSFKTFVQQRLFPGETMRVIAKDDPIFRYPYQFPNGPPPVYHHGGYNCLGVKKDDRWVVFYHPGDLKDAWSEGHAGLRPHLAEKAYQVGVNVVYYAFTHYLEETGSQSN